MIRYITPLPYHSGTTATRPTMLPGTTHLRNSLVVQRYSNHLRTGAHALAASPHLITVFSTTATAVSRETPAVHARSSGRLVRPHRPTPRMEQRPLRQGIPVQCSEDVPHYVSLADWFVSSGAAPVTSPYHCRSHASTSAYLSWGKFL